jgi:hypothetical protein
MFRKSILFIVVLGSAILLATACNINVTRGSGDLITETIEVSNFDSIALGGSGEVIITQGGSETLTIETDDNVMEHIEAEVRGGTLELGYKERVGAISPTRLIFRVGVDDLTAVSISGSGDIRSDEIDTDGLEVNIGGSGDVQITNLTADEVEIKIGGSGEIDLVGQVADQNISIGGSGKYRAGDLQSETAVVRVSGSGDVTVWVTETLDVSIGGSGSVNYYGRPSVSSSTSGSGDLNNLGDK